MSTKIGPPHTKPAVPPAIYSEDEENENVLLRQEGNGNSGGAQSNQRSGATAQSASSGATQQRPVLPAFAQFEYTGATALTAVGPITGRRYRFPAPGAIVEVDERDAPSLAAVPHLRRIRR